MPLPPESLRFQRRTKTTCVKAGVVVEPGGFEAGPAINFPLSLEASLARLLFGGWRSTCVQYVSACNACASATSVSNCLQSWSVYKAQAFSFQ
eukprot:5358-Prorocentrum_minimum.AAC.5